MGNIKYQQVVDLGFKRGDYEDRVVYRETGHHPFHMTKKLPGKIVIYWITGEQHYEILRLDKQANILGKEIIETIESLIRVLIFFGFREEVEEFQKKEGKDG